MRNIDQFDEEQVKHIKGFQAETLYATFKSILFSTINATMVGIIIKSKNKKLKIGSVSLV
jgi:hypothetical protein